MSQRYFRSLRNIFKFLLNIFKFILLNLPSIWKEIDVFNTPAMQSVIYIFICIQQVLTHKLMNSHTRRSRCSFVKTKKTYVNHTFDFSLPKLVPVNIDVNGMKE